MTAQRRERERRAVLAEAVAEMRRRGKAECEMADLLMDFKGIQVTLAVMAQALIDGRIDCKTAGRLAVELQTMSKLLWMMHKGRKTLPLMNPDSTDLKEVHAGKNWAANQGEKTRIPEKVLSMKDTKEHEGSVRIAVVTEIRAVADSHGCRDGPPEWAEAA
jgi:hypothetical protein